MIQHLLARLSEASTWAGIAAEAGNLGIDTSHLGWWGPAVHAAMGLAGLAAFLIPERSKQ